MDGHLTKVINQKIRQASPECTHPIRGLESQTSYPKVQWENTLDKRELQNHSWGAEGRDRDEERGRERDAERERERKRETEREKGKRS